MSAPYIPDGYTRFHRYDGSELHQPIGFEYRPMLAADRVRLIERIRRYGQDDSEGMAAAEQLVLHELDRRLVSWTLVDQTGGLLAISIDNLMRSEPHLLASLAVVVLGLAPDDADREASDEKNYAAGCGSCSPRPASPYATVGTANCTSTTSRRAAGNCTPGDRSCGQPARFPRAGCRMSVVRKELPTTPTRSQPRTSKFTNSIGSVGRSGATPMIRSSATTRS